jgi:hypothetical protein
MAGTGRGSTELATPTCPMEPSREAARPMPSWSATTVVEVVEITRSALRADRATRAANEAESGWPDACAEVERAAWAHLGRSIKRAGVAAGFGQRPTPVELSGSWCGPALVSRAGPPDRVTVGRVSALCVTCRSISPMPPGVLVTPWWQNTLPSPEDAEE